MGKDFEAMMKELDCRLIEHEYKIEELTDKVDRLITRCDSFHERILFLERAHLSADDDE